MKINKISEQVTNSWKKFLLEELTFLQPVICPAVMGV
jgi:hypothetical protein